MLSPYLEIFHENQKELFTQICQKHIEWGQTMAIVSLFSVQYSKEVLFLQRY